MVICRVPHTGHNRSQFHVEKLFVWITNVTFALIRKIAFEDIEEEDIIQRAWDDLIPNRILIYCL